MITFEQNLSRLLSLKQEAQNLLNLYQKDIKNINHLKQMEEQAKQIRGFHLENEYLREQLNDDQRRFSINLSQNISKIEQTKIELQLAQQEVDIREREIEKYKQKLKEKDEQLQFLEQEKQRLEVKQKRDIDNLKLMHNQELYILKKKEIKKQ